MDKLPRKVDSWDVALASFLVVVIGLWVMTAVSLFV